MTINSVANRKRAICRKHAQHFPNAIPFDIWFCAIFAILFHFVEWEWTTITTTNNIGGVKNSNESTPAPNDDDRSRKTAFFFLILPIYWWMNVNTYGWWYKHFQYLCLAILFSFCSPSMWHFEIKYLINHISYCGFLFFFFLFIVFWFICFSLKSTMYHFYSTKCIVAFIDKIA